METFISALHEKPESIDFPQVEPFIYETVTFKYNNAAMKGLYTIKNQRTYGISKVKVMSVKSSFDNDEMKLVVSNHFPKLFSTGTYRSNMTIGHFRIEAKGLILIFKFLKFCLIFNNFQGEFNVSMYDVTAKWNIKGKLKKIDGEDYMVVNSFDVLPEARDMKISATGLFPDEQLS